MILLSDSLLFKALEVIALLWLVSQVYSGFQFIRSGNLSYANTMQVTILLVLLISVFKFEFNRIHILWLIYAGHLISFAFSWIITQLSFINPLLALPFKIPLDALFKLYTLGISERKVWFRQTLTNQLAVTDLFGCDEEEASKNNQYMSFVNEVLLQSLLQLSANSSLKNLTFQAKTLNPNIVLFLAGVYEAIYKREIKPDSKYFELYFGQLYIAIANTLAALFGNQPKLYSSLEKEIAPILINLYYVHLEASPFIKKGLLKGKELDNFELFEDAPELLNYQLGKELVSEWIQAKDVRLNFIELFINWCSNNRLTFEDIVETRVKWYTWR